MRINRLKVKKWDTDWELLDIEFNDLTLLVGASGVGKSQILHCITILQNIAHGFAVSGFEWDVEFTTVDDVTYQWSGKYELDTIDMPKIITEKLLYNDKEMVERNQDDIFFNGHKTVRLPQERSILYLLKEEDALKGLKKYYI